MRTASYVCTLVVAVAAGAQQPGTWDWRRSILSPPARIPMVAYDEVRQRGVLFGGETSIFSIPGNSFDETWEWDGRDWRERATATASSPLGRRVGALAWDPVNQQTLLFGGHRHEIPRGERNDTWLWTGSVWTPTTPPVSPPARLYHSMATDPVRQRVVLFGGAALVGPPLVDTWEWDGSLWTRMQPLTRSPAVHWRAPMAWNPVTQRVALFGQLGNPVLPVEEWNGFDWVQRSGTGGLQPTGLEYSFAATDPAGLGVRVYGWRVNGLPTPTAHQWLWNGTHLTALTTTTPMPTTPASSGFVDVARNEIVLCPVENRTTWVLDLSTAAWSPRALVGGAPTTDFWRLDHVPWLDAYVGTLSNNNLWLRTESGHQDLGPAPTAGGIVCVHPGTRQVFWMDTQRRLWLYGWPGWTLTSIQVPGTGLIQVIGFDPVDQGVWCGVTSGIFKWYGTTFSPTTSVPLGSLGVAAFDSDRRVVAAYLVFGGPSPFWEWDGASWTAHPWPATASPSLAHVPGHGILLLEGGRVWEWDGSAWNVHVTPHFLPADVTGVQPVYDAARRKVRTLAWRTIYTFADSWDLQFHELTATPSEPQPGNTVLFQVESFAHAGQPWVLAMAMNTFPAIPLTGFHPDPFRVLPLSADQLLQASLGNGLTGFLDAQGRAQVSWTIPLMPALVGLRFFACAVSITPTVTAGLVSNPVEMYIAP